MDEKQIQNLINKSLEDFKQKNLSFRSQTKFDSVSDRYSPITGASQKIGFFGTSKIAKPTVTGSRGSNVALTSLLTALSNLGLLTDSSS